MPTAYSSSWRKASSISCAGSAHELKAKILRLRPPLHAQVPGADQKLWVGPE